MGDVAAGLITQPQRLPQLGGSTHLFGRFGLAAPGGGSLLLHRLFGYLLSGGPFGLGERHPTSCSPELTK